MYISTILWGPCQTKVLQHVAYGLTHPFILHAQNNKYLKYLGTYCTGDHIVSL